MKKGPARGLSILVFSLHKRLLSLALASGGFYPLGLLPKMTMFAARGYEKHLAR